MLTVTVTDGVASSNTITTGNNTISIAGVDDADAIAVNAGAPRQQHPDADRRRRLQRHRAHWQPRRQRAHRQGASRHHRPVAGLSIATGNGGNTINAQALTNNQVLTLTGDDAASVTLTPATSRRQPRRRAHRHRHRRDLASSNTITTGTNTISIDGADDTDAIAVNAAALRDDTTLTLTGRPTSTSPT